MTEVLATLAVLLLTLTLGYWLLRRRRPQGRPPSGEDAQALTPRAQLHRLQQSPLFWGVTVESHCRASSHLAGLEFSFDHAPPLPVTGCDAAHCVCRYVGLADRRKMQERRHGADRRDGLRMHADDRRINRPRRQADLNLWQSYRHI